MNKILKTLKNKESYIQRKSQQLRQWEHGINILRTRADKPKDKNNTEILDQIGKILVLKARSEYKLIQLQQSGNGKWNEIKAGLEKSLVGLRKSFLNASAKPNKNMSNSEKC